MKNPIHLLFLFAMLFSLARCTNSTPEKFCGNAAARAKIISTLMSDDAYMKEVMDSMKTKHADMILSAVFALANNDIQTQESMMDKMTGMCKMDSSACKMMMGKTMDMCDSDQSKCDMMMGSMQSIQM